MVLETQIWAPGLFLVPGVLLLLGPLSWQRKNMYGCVLNCVYTHTFNFFLCKVADFKKIFLELLKYSWFTMLWWFQIYSKMIQFYMYIDNIHKYISFKFSSIIGFYKIYSSLCYTASLFWLSILCIGVYILILSS